LLVGGGLVVARVGQGQGGCACCLSVGGTVLTSQESRGSYKQHNKGQAGRQGLRGFGCNHLGQGGGGREDAPKITLFIQVLSCRYRCNTICEEMEGNCLPPKNLFSRIHVSVQYCTVPRKHMGAPGRYTFYNFYKTALINRALYTRAKFRTRKYKGWSWVDTANTFTCEQKNILDFGFQYCSIS
jgi:hypothetical protein